MTESERSSCHKIIHTAAAAASAAAAGMAQIPGLDNTALIPIEVGMVIAVGKVFGKTLDETAAKAAVASGAAAVGGRTISQFLVGWIPGLGNVINATTAAGVVEAIGWWVAQDFDNNR